MAGELKPGDVTTLGNLRPGDVGVFSNNPDGGKFVVTDVLPSVNTTWIQYQHDTKPHARYSEQVVSGGWKVRYLGRGRTEPARIVMDGEPDRAAELEAGLTWANAKPTVPGWYWYRDEIGDHKDSWGMLKYPGGETIFDEGFSHPLDEFAGQFAGPLPQPEEPR